MQSSASCASFLSYSPRPHESRQPSILLQRRYHVYLDGASSTDLAATAVCSSPSNPDPCQLELGQVFDYRLLGARQILVFINRPRQFPSMPASPSASMAALALSFFFLLSASAFSLFASAVQSALLGVLEGPTPGMSGAWGEVCREKATMSERRWKKVGFSSGRPRACLHVSFVGGRGAGDGMQLAIGEPVCDHALNSPLLPLGIADGIDAGPGLVHDLLLGV